MRIRLNDDVLLIDVAGETTFGPDEVLLLKDDNLIAGTPWNGKGFGVTFFLPEEPRRALVSGIETMVRNALEKLTGKALPDFALINYHHFADNELHRKTISALDNGCFQAEKLPIDIALIENRMSEICGFPVQSRGPGVMIDFCLRIVRPHSNDNNPLHRDVWLDRLRNAVNIYVPIAGSDERSSLPIVPGSHLWRESEIERTKEGAIVNGIPFTVPAVVSAKHELLPVRPNPKAHEVLVFSPYLVHGAGANFNPDRTRVSLEMRFWRKR